MREIYTSPRQQNIDRVVALLADHDVATKVNNRASYQRPSYKRFSYANPGDTTAWPQVEVRFAADLTKARKIMREAGLEPLVRHADVLAASRDEGAHTPSPTRSRKTTVSRVRLIVMSAVTIVLVMMGLKAMQIF